MNICIAEAEKVEETPAEEKVEETPAEETPAAPTTSIFEKNKTVFNDL